MALSILQMPPRGWGAEQDHDADICLSDFATWRMTLVEVQELLLQASTEGFCLLKTKV